MPSELARIIDKSLEKNREDRYQSAAEMRVDLKRLRRDTSSGKASAANSDSAKSQLLDTTAQSASAQNAATPPIRKWTFAVVTIVVAALGFAAAEFFATPKFPHVVRITQLTSDGRPKGARMTTDGNRIYFSETIEGKSIVAQISTNGGNTSEVPVDLTHVVTFDYSTTRSELLVGSPSGAAYGFWRVPMPSGVPFRVGNLEGGSARISPDGNRIGYLKLDGSLHVAGIDGTSDRKIQIDERLKTIGVSSWIDDKTLVVDLNDRQTDEGVPWKIDVDEGKRSRIILSDKAYPNTCCAIWFPAFDMFFYERLHNIGLDFDIWATVGRSSLLGKRRDETRLTAGPLSYFSVLADRDGKRIFVYGKRFSSELVRYDSVKKQFMPFLGGISASHMSFSNDGEWVAYVDYPAGGLWRSRIDGSEKLQLTSDNNFYVVQPTWSPDGSQIAFTAIGGGTPWRMYRVKASGGSKPEPVLIESESQLGSSWSPDGQSITFGRVSGRGSNLSLHQLNLNSGKVTDIPGSGDLCQPVRSWDGGYLLALTGDGNAVKLYQFATQQWTEIARGNVGDYGFYRDGKAIFYSDSDKRGVFRVRLIDRKAELVADLHHVNQAETPYWTPWIGISPDGSPLVMRDLGTTEIYALELEK